MTQVSYHSGTRFLDDKIFEVLRQFSIQHGGALPGSIVVNPRNLADAGVILAAMDLGRLAVTGSIKVGINEARLL